MKVKSAKAKGRLLQNWVKFQLLDWMFTPSDVTVALMGEVGVDVKIIKAKQYMFPFKIECKSQKKGFSAVYDAYEQCEKHKEQGEPLVFIKQNRKKPLVIMDAKYFIKEYRR